MREFIGSIMIIVVMAVVVMALLFTSSYYASKPPVTDTYGNTTDSNETAVRESVNMATTGTTNALGGIMLFCGAMTLLAIGAYIVLKRPVY